MSTGNDSRCRGNVVVYSAMGSALSRITRLGRAPSRDEGRLPGDTVFYLVLLAAGLAGALAGAPIAGLWGTPAALALALYAGIAAIVVDAAKREVLHRFGAANGVTLLRAAMVAFLAALALLPTPLPAEIRILGIVLGIAGLLLDGVDGWLARRAGTASRFGGRFDMETDALSVLVFTLLLLRSGQAGLWVLAIGLARYIFVGVGWLWPPLARELPPSLRRKTICVVVVTAMLVALAPFVEAAPAWMICAAALVLLLSSFAMDCVWLLILRRTTPPPDDPKTAPA
jgi:phosphatidylglycerophosphate synthase